MEDIKKELTLQGFDPSLLSKGELLYLKEITEALRRGEKDRFALFLQQKTNLEKAHDAFLDELGELAEKTAAELLTIAQLPFVPSRGFSAACAKMLNGLSKVKESPFANLLLSLNVLREKLAQGEKDRLVLQKEHSLLSLALRLCEDKDAALPPISPSPFGDSLRAIFFDLSTVLGDFEAFLSSFALSAARVAKRVDKGEASPTEYGRLIEGARIRLHDLSVNTRHIRKETDHVKIHTRP